jgi:predicted acetyltransferase
MAVKIFVTDVTHVKYTQAISDLIQISAKQRGTGIVSRTNDYIADRIGQGKAVIALDNGEAVGFSYIETWSHGMFVANSGLVVAHDHRYTGLARKIKKQIFELSRKLYPNAKIFSITTGLAVMKINSELGYVPVTFSEITRDIEFWMGCDGCKNFDILQRNDYKMCLCTGLMFDPAKQKSGKKTPLIVVPQELPFRLLFVMPFIFTRRVFQRLSIKIKRYRLHKKINKQHNCKDGARTTPTEN